MPIVVLGAALVLWGYCLADFAHTPEPLMRTFTRDQWLVILVLGSVVGSIAWLRVGRPPRHWRA